LEAAFADMEKRRIGAIVVSGDIFFNSRRDQIIALAARHAVPAIYEWRDFVTAGGLMNYVNERHRRLSPSRKLCRSNSQRRSAERLTGRTTDEI
jgi:hypothetical protein